MGFTRDTNIGVPPAETETNNPGFSTARTLTSPVTLTGALKYVYQQVLSRPFYYGGTHLSWNSGAWATAESVTANIDIMVDGVNWENMWTVTRAAASAPLSVYIPYIVDASLVRNPFGFWVDGTGIRVGIVQTVVGAGYHVISHSTIEGL